MTIKEFTKDFFDREKCPLRQRKQIRGFDWARGTMATRKGNLDNWILPRFGHREIESVTYNEIDDYIIELLDAKKLSESSVNGILHTIQIIFQEATRQKIIEYDFTQNVERIRVKKKGKGILTNEEVLQLFLNDDNWKYREHKIINEIACWTGMRIGEVIALGYDSLFEAEGHNFLYVNKSWDPMEGITPTKTRKNRLVPIPPWIVREIKSISWISNFWFTGEEGKPLSRQAVRNNFYNALKKIGIDKEERKRRRISFHSWRHRYISELTGEITQEELRLIVGHATEMMTNHYTQQILDKTKEIINSDFFREE